jgi:flavin-binding protein dodecin
MPDQLDTSAVKIIEIMGVSNESFADAVDKAVAKAAESVNGIISVEVVRQTGSVEDGRIVRYESTVKLSFTVR